MPGSAERKNLLTGFLFALLAVVLWSGNFIVARALNHSIPPVALAFFRWIIATAFLFPIAFRKVVEDRQPLVTHLPYLSVTALTGVTLFNTFIYIAGKHSSATNLALIGTTAAPVFVLLITGLFLKQRVTVYQTIGALFCIAGILVLISKGSLAQLLHFHFSAGDGWIILAGLSFAVYTVLVRRKPAAISPLAFLFALFFLGTLFLLPAYLIDAARNDGFQWSRTVILVLLYLGIGASVVAFLSWNISIRRLGAPRTALFGNLIPVFSTIEAALILDEDFSSITLISFLVILAGLAIANLGKQEGR